MSDQKTVELLTAVRAAKLREIPYSLHSLLSDDEIAALSGVRTKDVKYISDTLWTIDTGAIVTCASYTVIPDGGDDEAICELIKLGDVALSILCKKMVIVNGKKIGIPGSASDLESLIAFVERRKKTDSKVGHDQIREVIIESVRLLINRAHEIMYDLDCSPDVPMAMISENANERTWERICRMYSNIYQNADNTQQEEMETKGAA